MKKAIYSPEYGGPGRLVAYETVVRSKSGELIPIELSASLIFEDDQEVGTVGFFRDLRERKALQEKVLQAERLAVLGRMSAHISHEIKTPSCSSAALPARCGTTWERIRKRTARSWISSWRRSSAWKTSWWRWGLHQILRTS